MKEQAQKALYAMVGAPVVFSRHMTDAGFKVSESMNREYGTWIVEGEKVTKKVRGSEVVEELSARVDIDQLQDQVEKLRDQLETALSHWRESFRPEVKEAEEKVTATRPAAKKPAAKKTTTTTAKKTTTTAAKKTTTTAAQKPAAAKKTATDETATG